MTVPLMPICAACELYEVTTDTCRAFPEGIPTPILWQGRDHRKAYPHDDGVRFTLDETKRDLLDLYESQ